MLAYVLSFLEFIFFFQAEDGIRDLTVTGVQTCALPISCPRTGAGASSPASRRPRRSSRAWRWASGGWTKDRKRGGEGKRVDFGGGRIIKKKKKERHVWDRYNCEAVTTQWTVIAGLRRLR